MAFLRTLHHDGCANDMSSRGDVEQQVLTRQWSGEDRGRLEMMLEIFQRLHHLLCPLELVLPLQELEER
jgi:hypothetical protein